MAKIAKDAELDLSLEDAKKAMLAAMQPKLQEARSILSQLGSSLSAPQVLLLEGGVEEERQAMGLWWAALQHCKQRQSDAPQSLATEPCGRCSGCLHIGAHIHPDVLSFDGRISNTADKENPGPVRALTKENAVALKAKLGDTTRSGQKRVIIMSGLEKSARSEAANALLKVLEEPSPVNLFVLLTAQREQILPTLVSRSWVYTLPWPNTHAVPRSLVPWEDALAHFLRSGQGWWEMTSTKGAVTLELALQVLLLCQKRLATSLASPEQGVETGALTSCFTKLSAQKRLTLSQKIDAASETLHFTVNPARVLDVLAVDMYLLLRS